MWGHHLRLQGNARRMKSYENRLQRCSIALWQSCFIGCKINHKVVNFGKWFLCQFSPKTWNFLHGAFLTPQKLEDEKVLQIYACKEGKKEKKTWRGCFSQTKWVPKKLYCWMLWYLLFEHLWKTPSCRRKLHPKSEKKFYKYLTYFFGCCRAAKYPVYKFTFTFLGFYF